MVIVEESPHRGLFLLRKGIAIVIPYTGKGERSSDSQVKTGDWGFDDSQWKSKGLELSRQSASILDY